jgi:biotin transport system substrate-specific component
MKLQHETPKQNLLQSLVLSPYQVELNWLTQVVFVACGVLLLAALAQVAIPLPFTPVPITGQSFGVLLIALFYGRKLGTATTLSYILLGAGGLPIFAEFRSGLAFPTFGYLIGMLAATYAVGILSDRGWTRYFGVALAACLLGKVLIFAFGLAGLSFFVPAKQLLVMGLYPFLPGLVIKAVLAAGIAVGLSRTR